MNTYQKTTPKNYRRIKIGDSVKKKIIRMSNGRSWEENAEEINAEIQHNIQQRKLLLEQGIDPHENTKYFRSPYF